MLNQLDKEEAKLRRKLLLRLLKGFNFDAPRFQSEAISDAIPRQLMTAETEQYKKRHFLKPADYARPSLA
ncbi:peptidyl-tRNA hydrolase [Roseobacter sp. SK209-2-6]|uniref:hypothetical protein n=1 Tax=Roseobacter sp. SK209-2-6 TaxID=388739 RepID=UPI0000F3CD2E|nr:hypothetical protein [Roseobacter sp. SK209-2-6]EBA16012.1 peptidyl-tRNA hydrolase [Roseobacter sp. SK209-2-6]